MVGLTDVGRYDPADELYHSIRDSREGPDDKDKVGVPAAVVDLAALRLDGPTGRGVNDQEDWKLQARVSLK